MNIHIIPTDKPSKLYKVKGKYNFDKYLVQSVNAENQNIYMTSDEEIKRRDWFINESNQIEKGIEYYDYKVLSPECKLVIMTTDKDLIKDGIQAIDDEFLEWFVKNPSCEKVEIVKCRGYLHLSYMIIIPQEEPKQETVEEAAYRILHRNEVSDEDMIMSYTFPKTIKSMVEMAKWQAERMYSEEEIAIAFNEGQAYSVTGKLVDGKEWVKTHKKEWFEQHKKK